MLKTLFPETKIKWGDTEQRGEWTWMLFPIDDYITLELCIGYHPESEKPKIYVNEIEIPDKYLSTVKFNPWEYETSRDITGRLYREVTRYSLSLTIRLDFASQQLSLALLDENYHVKADFNDIHVNDDYYVGNIKIGDNCETIELIPYC